MATLTATDYIISCFRRIEDVSPEWPISQRSKREQSSCTATPNYHIFQTATFLQVWAQTYAIMKQAELCLIEVRTSDGQPVLFLPLAIMPVCGIRLLSFTGQTVADYNVPILFKTDIRWTKQNAEYLWQQIAKILPEHDFVDFNNMPEHIGTLRNPLALLATGANGENSHANLLTKELTAIENDLSSLRNTKRKLRRLNSLGDCVFSVVTTEQERQACLDFLIYQKQRRFIETKVPGFETHPEKLAYFQQATSVFHEAGFLHLTVLKLNGEIIACMWGLVNGPYYYGIMIASNLCSWAKYSPGHILHYLLIRLLKQQGFHILDLGVGDEIWKLQSCDLTIPLKRMSYPVTWRGRCYALQRHIMTYLRSTRIWQRLRPLKWQIIRKITR